MATVASYTSGTVVAAGGTVSGTVNVVNRTGYDELQFPTNATSDYVRFDVSALSQFTEQFYLHTPAAWSAVGNLDMFRASVGASPITSRLRFGGTSDAGRLVLVRDASTVAAQSATGIIDVSNVYRVLHNVDAANSTQRLRVFALGSDTPLYDSGTIAGTTTTGVTRLLFGDNSGDHTTLGVWGISRIQVTNAIETLARHSTDTTPLATPAVTLGASTNPSTTGGTNGTQVVTFPAVSGAASYEAWISLGLDPTETPAQGDFTLVATGVGGSSTPRTYTFTGLPAGRHAFGIKAKA